MARPLKMFMRGKSVSMLQELLRSIGYKIDDRSSMFGSSTRDAVKSFQRQRNLKVTGQVDDALLKMMQQGEDAPSRRSKNTDKKKQVSEPDVTMVSQEKFDALIRLMVRKGLFDEQELKDEMERVIPTRITQPPFV